MTAPARLLALRLHGFKSFAERTVVEFGPGISAIVGPNGSGKSNLADALRWTLGEQGRALRSRKSEDVIFAGSDRRAAVGMADVTLVLDNGDGLLPVEYSVLELGRRLYRSGENDYLLNKQRVRLRDLVDLLDAAHLADNAFLFIGQGMVDQALALRPEERRPLFEEVAGVRRHERRRRKAEEQLAEAELNLARVDDILAELRPQARRLAAQAEQQVTRASAGDELAAALVVAAHGRWHEASGRRAAAVRRLERARADADLAMAELTEAEGSAAALSTALGDRATLERDRREAHETVRTALAELRLREARLVGDLAGIVRDRERLDTERQTAEADLAIRRREAALPVSERDVELDATLAEAERGLAEALEEIGALRAARQARGDEQATLRRAEAARVVELEAARRRLAETERRATEERARAERTAADRAGLDTRHADATQAAAKARELEELAVAAREAARTAADEADGASRAADEATTAAAARVAGLRGSLEAARASVAEEEGRGIARAARRVGGRRLDEDLQVEPAFRAAVEAALGEVARAYLVGREAVPGLAGERGLVVIDGPTSATPRPDGPFLDRLAGLGGGVLTDAVRRDPVGAARRILERVAWVPDLAAVIDLQPGLPPGWAIVSRDGAAVAGPVAIALGRPSGALDRAAELERLATELGRLEGNAAELERVAAAARDVASATRTGLEDARAEEARASAARRAADDAERAEGRAAEAAAREAGWAAAQAERATLEADRARAVVAGLEADAAERSGRRIHRVLGHHRHRCRGARGTRHLGGTGGRPAGAPRPARRGAGDRRDGPARGGGGRGPGHGRGHVRRGADRPRRGRRAGARGAGGRAARRARTARRRRRGRRSPRSVGAGGPRRAPLGGRRRSGAPARRGGARHPVLASGSGPPRSASARPRSPTSRPGWVSTRSGSRSSSSSRGSARSGSARSGRRPSRPRSRGTGPDGAPAPRWMRPAPRPPRSSDGAAAELGDGGGDDETAELEAILPFVLPVWEAAAPATEPPTPGRLATLRRRFHELGAANPFAVQEYAELRARLESLETQGADLRDAIARTRTLIDELATMIADQFRTTFRALETAFDERFKQLFGGGFARLDLTDPTDLAATGVEIVARPPGKKAQSLAMLSGGERALTAVALLFAMLEVRPVPFCVLDEVDAALDEANVGRFSEALRGLADQTQFIVITHNRGTIEAADALYGVTVGDDSVSRVISLRLDEATAIAATAAGNGAAALDPVGS